MINSLLLTSKKHLYALSILLTFVLAMPVNVFATSESSHGGTTHFGLIFFLFALVLIAGKVGGIVERYGQPAVIGELLAGIVLSGFGYFGWNLISQAADSTIISFIASFGALLLLFSIGLESNVHEMKKVGINALAVALIGVVLPFVLGAYLLAPLLFENISANTKLFIGASLVATSVGITCSVFRSLNLLKTRAAQTVLGAAIIDDILGLIVLAVVSALITGGNVTLIGVLGITAKSFGFLAGAVLLGSVFTKHVSNLLRSIHSGIGMKVTLAIGFALLFGYIAELFGLEPIIGAFAAGLFLDAVHFKDFDDPSMVEDIKKIEFESATDRTAMLNVMNKHKEKHVDDLVNTIGHIFIPVFFVYTGMQIDFASLLQPQLYVTAFLIAIVAFITKLIAGFAAKGGLREKILVGVSMVPRGEVGLIFAATGKSLGVLSNEVFSVIVLVVIMTTFIAPPLIKSIATTNLTRAKIKLKLRFASQ